LCHCWVPRAILLSHGHCKNRNSMECSSEILTSSLCWLGGLDLSQRKCFRLYRAKHQLLSTSAELVITSSGWDDVFTNCTASTNDRQHDGSSCDGNTSSNKSAGFYLRKDRSAESSVLLVHVRVSCTPPSSGSRHNHLLYYI
jgi:hypothetical protein